MWFRRNQLGCEICYVLEYNVIWTTNIVGLYPFCSDRCLKPFLSSQWWPIRQVPIWRSLWSVVPVRIDFDPIFFCLQSYCSDRGSGSFLCTVWIYAIAIWLLVFPFSWKWVGWSSDGFFSFFVDPCSEVFPFEELVLSKVLLLSKILLLSNSFLLAAPCFIVSEGQANEAIACNNALLFVLY